MIPVMYLSDGFLANGSEPWKFPQTDNLPDINVEFEAPRSEEAVKFLPYLRDERFVRHWSIPGTEGLEHRVGGLEKEDKTGDVSYDPDNHQQMVEMREAKRDKISEFIPQQEVDSGTQGGEVVVVGWGSTYGSISTAVHELQNEGMDISHIHIRYLAPFPSNLGELLEGYGQVLVPEINNGQLVRLLRDQFVIPATGINKIKGRPFGVEELKQEIRDAVSSPVSK